VSLKISLRFSAHERSPVTLRVYWFGYLTFYLLDVGVDEEKIDELAEKMEVTCSMH
jgi:hypothetical protein